MRWSAIVCSAITTACPALALAFTHVVQPGETLAQISERVYGTTSEEVVLVGANALDVQGGAVIVAGMRLEIPAPGHHTVQVGEGWADLALHWLGNGEIARADVLARNNHGVPWVPPTPGQEIEIPAVVTYIAGDGETVRSIAEKFWGDPNRGWELNPYNRRDGVVVKRGEIILVPFMHLKLSAAGKAEARAAAERDGATGAALDQQRKADAELPELAADVRYGRYAEAIARGGRLVSVPSLTKPQLASVHRALLEAYVATEARAAATAACAAWRSYDPAATLDPVTLSPKILAACAR